MMQHTDAVIPLSPNPVSRTQPQPAIDHHNTVSNFHDDNICVTCFRCSALAVWNSLPKTVLNSDFATVFKPRLKTFLFSSAHQCAAWHQRLVPLKLRPYGATQTCLLLLLLLLSSRNAELPASDVPCDDVPQHRSKDCHTMPLGLLCVLTCHRHQTTGRIQTNIHRHTTAEWLACLTAV